MPSLSHILTPGRTVCNAPVVSKKRLLETIAGIISEDQPSLTYGEVLEHLIAREKLGSTGLGQGIAIPHCRASNCDQWRGIVAGSEGAGKRRGGMRTLSPATRR